MIERDVAIFVAGAATLSVILFSMAFWIWKRRSTVQVHIYHFTEFSSLILPAGEDSEAVAKETVGDDYLTTFLKREERTMLKKEFDQLSEWGG